MVLPAVMLFNLRGAWWALHRARALGPRLSLPATRRHLSFGADAGLNHVERPIEP